MKDEKNHKTKEEVFNFSLQPSTFNLILNCLPHRYPFLMVDKVLEVVPGQRGRGIKLITQNDDWLQGSAAQGFAWPGFFFIEALAQLAAVTAANPGEPASGRGLLIQVKNFSVQKNPLPGDLIYLTVERVTGFGSLHQFHGQAVIEGETVAGGELVFTLTGR